MAVIFSDTWTGTNGDAWNAQWTKSGSQTTDIQSNEGRVVTGSSANDSTAMRCTDPLSAIDYTGVVKLKFTTITDGEFYYFIHFRGSSTFAGTPVCLANSYELRVIWYNPGTSIGVNFYEISGTGTKTYRNGADHLASTIAAGDSVWFKWEVGGAPTNRLRYRIWKDGDSEPGTWTNDWSGSVVADNRGSYMALIVQNGSTTTSEDLTFDGLSLDDGSTPHPIPPPNLSRWRV